MESKKYAKLFRELSACKKRISKERDILRGLQEEMEALEYSCERAEHSLEDAADALSELL